MKISDLAERYRVTRGTWRSQRGNLFGSFLIPGPFGELLRIIASAANQVVPWDHVSISTRRRCPYWKEMCFVKDQFWSEEETVMQIHPPKSEWVNNSPFCLHLWRPTGQEIPMPPPIAVGIKELGVIPNVFDK